MLVRSKFFSLFVKKIEKLELSLSKQHNKMLKIRCEMLKIIKNVKMIQLGKISRKFFPGISRIPGIPRIFEIILVYREVENPEKRKTLITSLTRLLKPIHERTIMTQKKVRIAGVKQELHRGQSKLLRNTSESTRTRSANNGSRHFRLWVEKILNIGLHNYFDVMIFFCFSFFQVLF